MTEYRLPRRHRLLARHFAGGVLALVALASANCKSPSRGDGDPASTRSTAPAAALPGNFVDLRRFDPAIVVDLRYARPDNFTGKALYPRDMPCFVHAGTAEKLREANAALRKEGYGLKVWDAYRPPAVHRRLFEALPNGQWIAEPGVSWSRHCYGAAVDVTLVDRKGRDQPMPSAFDDFSEGSSTLYTGDDPVVRANLRRLQRAMVAAGFKAFVHEWWHFNDVEAAPIRLVDARELGIVLPGE